VVVEVFENPGPEHVVILVQEVVVKREVTVPEMLAVKVAEQSETVVALQDEFEEVDFRAEEGSSLLFSEGSSSVTVGGG
jgi:hypothetical protein